MADIDITSLSPDEINVLLSRLKQAAARMSDPDDGQIVAAPSPSNVKEEMPTISSTDDVDHDTKVAASSIKLERQKRIAYSQAEKYRLCKKYKEGKEKETYKSFRDFLNHEEQVNEGLNLAVSNFSRWMRDYDQNKLDPTSPVKKKFESKYTRLESIIIPRDPKKRTSYSQADKYRLCKKYKDGKEKNIYKSFRDFVTHRDQTDEGLNIAVSNFARWMKDFEGKKIDPGSELRKKRLGGKQCQSPKEEMIEYSFLTEQTKISPVEELKLPASTFAPALALPPPSIPLLSPPPHVTPLITPSTTPATRKPQKRSAYSQADKYRLCKKYKEGKDKEIYKSFRDFLTHTDQVNNGVTLAVSNFSRWMRDFEDQRIDPNSAVKKKIVSRYPKTEEILVNYIKGDLWLEEQPVLTWRFMREKAIEFNRQLNEDVQEFKASPGWLGALLKRHKISISGINKHLEAHEPSYDYFEA